ncbi:hypothetical protein OK016_21750 [Vibrio chagasii]|nr:hypothetical protein [Vibrio chagasii]
MAPTFVDGLGSEVRQGGKPLEKQSAFNLMPLCLHIDAVRHQKILKQAQDLGITIIGWHATELAGGNPEIGLFTNITTDPLDVAETLLYCLLLTPCRQIVVFYRPKLRNCDDKSECNGDTTATSAASVMLELIYLPLDQIDQKMPSTLKMFFDKKYGDNITHILAINDLYIDYAIPSLESKNRR